MSGGFVRASTGVIEQSPVIEIDPAFGSFNQGAGKPERSVAKVPMADDWPFMATGWSGNR